MDRPPRTASHLPVIKCSTCGQDIDPSMMSNHVCSSPSLGPSTSTTADNYSHSINATSANLPPRGASFLRPQRPVLPKIDSSVAAPVPFAGELTPASSGYGSVGSPVSATSGRKSPWRGPTRRPTIMVQQGPPSPELVSQDCAFPPFPVINSKDSKKDDKAKSKGDRHNKSRAASPASSSRSSKQYLGPSPLGRSASSDSSRQRSKSISGDTRSRRPSVSTNGRRPSTSNNGSRKPSTEEVPPLPISSSEASIRPTPAHPLDRAETAPSFPSKHGGNEDSMGRLQRYATTDGILHDEPEPIDVMPQQATAMEPDVYFTNPFPLAQPAQESEPAYRSKRPPPIVSNITMPPRGINPKMRSPTVPPPTSATSLSRSLTKIFGRRRSQSTSAARRDMVRTALSDEPTPPIPQSAFESPRPSPSTPGSAGEHAAPSSFVPVSPQNFATEHEESPKGSEESDSTLIPPAINEPVVEADSSAETMRFKFDWAQSELKESFLEPSPSESIARRPTEVDLNRVSIDSASSYGSVGFDDRTASSRSSPPPTDELANKFSDSLQAEGTTTQMTIVDMPGHLRPTYPELSADSPTDPLFIDGRLSPIPAEKPKEAENPPVVVEMPPPPLPAVPVRMDSLAPGSKLSGPNKGICRGCSKPILPKQKSVTSADGRLTGRYHKACFVCSTCRSSFPTAEFYVHADRPYCAHHYHQQENSLCATCDQGIEGLYMETANVAGRGREKHHPKCLKCTTCRIQLTTDYFELSGKVYCERDAFRLASIPRVHDRSPARPSPLVREYISSGDPKLLQKGTNFPERRTTQIMTMI